VTKSPDATPWKPKGIDVIRKDGFDYWPIWYRGKERWLKVPVEYRRSCHIVRPTPSRRKTPPDDNALTF
jgi:hypothetical protein